MLFSVWACELHVSALITELRRECQLMMGIFTSAAAKDSRHAAHSATAKAIAFPPTLISPCMRVLLLLLGTIGFLPPLGR